MSIPPICQGILTLTTALVNPISYHLFCKCTPKNNISSHFHSYMLQTYLSLSMHFLPYVTNRPLSKYAFFYPMLQTDLYPSMHFLYPCCVCATNEIPLCNMYRIPCLCIKKYTLLLSYPIHCRCDIFSALQLHIFCCIFIKMQNLIKCIPIFRHCRTNFSNNATTPFFLLSSHFPYDQKHFIFQGFF